MLAPKKNIISDFRIVWEIKKVTQLSPLKDKNSYPLCNSMRECFCKENYKGKTKQNVITRWNEQENPNKDSKPTKHLSTS